jgi:hypothetical protein
MTIFTEVRDTLHARPVGSCIYCGSRDDLTDEHIIPAALGGNYVLPQSSCKDCNKITSKFEREVLRGFMWEARVAANFPTRRPKERPKTLPLEVERGGKYETVQIAASDHPGFLDLPLLAPAGVLVGRPPTRGVMIQGHERLLFGKHPGDVLKQLGATAMKATFNWDVTAFAKLLAKIGYGMAVAHLGALPLDQIKVLPLIRGEADDASYWIGSETFRLKIEERRPNHAAMLMRVPDPGERFADLLCVRVKLFAPSGATGYRVVLRKVWRPIGVPAEPR